MQTEPTKKWTVEVAQPRDKKAIRVLFQTVFEAPMSEELWQWKYGNGRGCAAVAKRDGAVIAHFGGVFRDVWYNGEQQRSMQCVDVMVTPSERGSLTRSGPFYLAAKHLLDRQVGTNRPCALGFGFPQARLLKMSEHLAIQTPIGEILEPVWHARRSDAYTGQNVDLANSQHQAQLQQLFVQMRTGLSPSIVGVRDVSYLKHRYLEHPLYKYQLKLVSRANSPRTVLGMVVLRVADEQVLIMDLIGDPQYFANLIEYAQTQNTSLGAHELSMWISAAHLPLLGNAYARVDDPKVQTPTIICTPGPSPKSLMNKWFLTTGDTDFK